MQKKLEFLLGTIRLNWPTLKWYHHLKPNKIRKTFIVKNSIRDDLAALLKEFGLSEYKDIIGNEYVKLAKSTMKIGKWAQRKLPKADFAKFSNKYAKMLSQAKTEGKLIISNKLIDCLCASNLTMGWDSCQGFDYGSDCRALANLIYYLSSNVYIAAIENSDGVKVFRQWIYLPKLITTTSEDNATKPLIQYDENKLVIFGRPYPNSNPTLENFIRQKFMERVFNVPIHTIRFIENDSDTNKLEFNNYTNDIPYPDILHKAIYRIVALQKENLSLFENATRINISFLDIKEKDLKCIYCGNKVSSINDFDGKGSCCIHDHDQLACYSCNSLTDEDEVLYVRDDPYCERCFDDNFFYCNRCNEIFDQDVATQGSDNCMYCEECWERQFGTCYHCDETFKLSELEEIEGDLYCEVCSGDVFGYCNKCDTFVRQTELKEIKGEMYCEECANELQKVG